MSLARPILARLAAASGGNPFFALEIARVLARTGASVRSTIRFLCRWLYQELVAARVRALTGAAMEAVLVASALSRPTAAKVTRAFVAQGEAGAALTEAEEAGVLVSDHGRIQFTHPLLASAVYGSVSQEQRRRLHRRLAGVVDDPEERARHLALSADEVDESAAAEVEQAARQASLRGAQDAAAELFEAACRLTPADRPDELARRLIGQADSLRALSSLSAARLLAERASEAPAAPPLKVEALLCLAGIDWVEGAISDANEHLEQALLSASDDDQLRARIYTTLARFNVVFDPRRAVKYADAPMQLLREDRQPELLASTLIDLFFAEAMLGRRTRRQLFDRGLELEARSRQAAEKHPIPLLWFQFTDDFDAVRARYSEEDELYRELGWESSRADRLGHLALAELRAGRWALAQQYIEESCSAVLLADARGPVAMRFAFRPLIDAHCGKVERARATLAPLIEQFAAAEQVWWTAMSLSTRLRRVRGR